MTRMLLCALWSATALAQEAGEPVDPPTTDTHLEAPTHRSAHLLHLQAVALGDLVSKQGGASIGASWSVRRRIDVGGELVLGQRVGLRGTATFQVLHSYEGLIPFLQARAVLNPVPGGVGVGLGGGAGAWYEVGPGRISAGLLVEVVGGPANYYPASVLAFAGYEFDWPGLGPKPDLAPKVASKTPPPTPETQPTAQPLAAAGIGMDLTDVAPAPARAVVVASVEKGVLDALVLDSDGEPIRSQLGVSASADGSQKLFTPAPRLDTHLPVGDYVAVAAAAGHLTQARSFHVDAGGKVSLEFRLRPAPETQRVALSRKRVRLEEPITFDPGVASVADSAQPLLDEVVDLLIANPAVRLRIEDRTDEADQPENNMKLAQDRAREVMRYLVEHGVASSRLTAVGYGMEKADATPDDKELSRRLKLEIVEEQ